MNSLNQVFLLVVEISWQASVLTLIVWLTQRLFRQWLNPRWYYALWFLVVLRLLLPVTPESPVSGYRYLPQTPINRNGDFVNQSLPLEPLVSNQSAQYPDSSAPKVVYSVTKYQIPLLTILSLIWLAGLIAWAAFILVSSWSFRRRLRELQDVWHPVVRDAMHAACALLKIKRRPQVVEAPFVATPCLTGLFHPLIILPENCADRFSAEELRLILLHELAHYKRGDLIIQWLVTWLQAVHWFNPFLWFAFRRIRLDREPATDAMVLDRAGVDAKNSYGNALLTLLKDFQQVKMGAGVVGILEDKKEIKRRFQILSIVNSKAYAWSTLALVLILVLGAIFLTKKSTEKAVAGKTNPIHASQLQPFRKAALSGDGSSALELVTASFATDFPLTEDDVSRVLNELWDRRELTRFAHLLEKMRMTNLGKNWSPDESRLRSMVQDGRQDFLDVLLLDSAEPLDFNALKVVQGTASPEMSAWIDLRIEKVGGNRKNQDAFVEAANKGDLVKMRELLAVGIDINGVASDNHTALTRAAGADQKESVRFLLKQGAQPDKAKHPGWDYTPLCLARSVEVADMLKAAGANVYAKLYRRDVSILTYAARWNGAVMVPWFIENGIDPHKINDNEETFLFDAGDGKAVRYLLEKGLDPNHKNKFGNLALFSANDEESVLAMVEYGLNLETVEKEAKSPLIQMMIQSFAGVGALKAVLESGKVDRSPEVMQRALCLAARSDRDEVLRLLVQYGADVNKPEVRIYEGKEFFMMPLMATTLSDQAKAAKTLLELGADPNLGTPSGIFLKNAMANGSKKVAKLLREFGAKGVPDLAYQIAQRNQNAIQALLTNAPPYSTSPEFWKSVMVEAARTGNREALEIAFKKGVPVFENLKLLNSSDNPYRTAAEEGQHEVLELLISKRSKAATDGTWLIDALMGVLWNCNPYETQRKKIHFEKTVEVLLRSGLDIKNEQAKQAGRNFVTQAVFTRNPGGNGRVVEMLVAAGADPNPIVEKEVRLVEYLQKEFIKTGYQKPAASTLEAIEKVNHVKFNFKTTQQ